MMTSPSQSTEQALPWPARRDEGAHSSYLMTTIFIVAALTIVRLVGLRFSVVDLFYDEAQYWSWSRDLALGYYTKPPLLAWIIAAATHVCGNDEWCVRAPSPLLYAATSMVVYAIGTRLYGERTGFWAALLTAFGTGVVFSSRIISTDVPLLFFWAVALWAYVNLLSGPSKRWAVVLGVSIGLGLLAKYAMIYFLPGVALAALFSKRARMTVARPDIWLALLVATLVVAPNIAWNASNGFATLEHTGDIVLGDPVHPSIMRALEFLATQFAVFGPVVFAVALVALLRLASRDLVEQDRILIAFFLPAIAIVTAFAVGVKANGNWAATSVISGVVVAAAVLCRHEATFWMRASVIVGLVAQIAFAGTDAIATRLSLAHVGNPYHRTIGLRQYAEAIERVARRAGAKAIVTDSRADFATLGYYGRNWREQILWWRRVEVPKFAMSGALTQQSVEPLLYVTGCASLNEVNKVYATVEPLGRFVAPIGEGPQSGEREFYAFRLSGARGPIPPFVRC